MHSALSTVRFFIIVLCLGMTFGCATNEENLSRAVSDGDLSRVMGLIDDKADVNAKDTEGRTALMYASEKGHIEVVKALIAANADVNAENADGWTALMYASRNGHIEVVKALIDHSATVANGEHTVGDRWVTDCPTVLTMALSSRNRELKRYLLKHLMDSKKVVLYVRPPAFLRSYRHAGPGGDEGEIFVSCDSLHQSSAFVLEPGNYALIVDYRDTQGGAEYFAARPIRINFAPTPGGMYECVGVMHGSVVHHLTWECRTDRVSLEQLIIRLSYGGGQ